MTYRPNDEAAKWEAPPGVAPWRDLPDAEFEALRADHPGIERFFDHIDAGAVTRKKRGDDPRGRKMSDAEGD